MIGETIAHYRITAKLGEGGMGEVYRATDTKLKREVALKVLPVVFASDPERMARFQREAEVLASLNHPNIAQIYDVEDRALVMELVEGESPKGPMAFEEAWKIASQIAAGLEYAHEKGIVHRDLKPANIKVTADGVVKLLDFGLAKAFTGQATASGNLENSPTLTLGATQLGVILGTAAYMAPEQAKGKPVDKRADIWSFGVVLYELLSGEHLFTGEDVSDTLAQVLTKEPDLNRVPPRARPLLRRCLEKDPTCRLRDVGDAVALLDSGQTTLAPVKPRPAWTPWAIAVLALAGMAALAVIHLREPPPILEAVKFSMEAPPDTTFVDPYGGYAPSPDGQSVVFSAATGKGGYSLWLRPLDSLNARPLAGTEGGNFPTWSPDSRSLVFYADGKLKRVEINGGAPLVLSDADAGSQVTPTGTWNRGGVILFGSSAGLKRVYASGGGTVLLTKVDPGRKENGHGYPQFLPDGDRFLYFIASEDSNVQGVYASSLRDPGSRRLILRTDAKAVYIPPGPKGDGPYPGYLLWMQDQMLLAQRFDAGSLRLEGDPVSVAEGIGRLTGAPIRAAFWASDAGTLIYFANALFTRPLVWMNREGKRLGEAAPADNFLGFALAPGAKRVAVTRAGASSAQSNSDIWVRELDRGVMTRLTSDPATDRNPVWSSDGKWIAFSSSREGGVLQIYRKEVSGGGQEQRLTEGPNAKFVLDWSHDYILYVELPSSITSKLMALPADGASKSIPVAEGISPLSSAAISPDGRWVAYGSQFSGSLEIYVQAFPPGWPGKDAPQGRTQISIAGGSNPKWRGDGKELYYTSAAATRGSSTALMAAAIQVFPQGIRAEAPRELFNAGALFNYDVTPESQRFLLMPITQEQQQRRLNVVSHWQAALRH